MINIFTLPQTSIEIIIYNSQMFEKMLIVHRISVFVYLNLIFSLRALRCFAGMKKKGTGISCKYVIADLKQLKYCCITNKMLHILHVSLIITDYWTIKFIIKMLDDFYCRLSLQLSPKRICRKTTQWAIKLDFVFRK